MLKTKLSSLREFNENCQTGCRRASYEKMLEKEELDVLYICTPPFAHDQVEISAAEGGIHFFVKKPISLSLKKVKEIEVALIKNKIITSVGYFKDKVIEYDGGIKIVKPNQMSKISSSVDTGLLEDQLFIEMVKTKDTSRIR